MAATYPKAERLVRTNINLLKAGYTRIHTSPVDYYHRIEVWKHKGKGNRYFIPLYSRDGFMFSPYTSGGESVATTSYASAMKYIRRGQR